MDIDTTSINELPVATVPHQSGESAMQQNNTTTSAHITMDPQTAQVPEYAKTDKRVQFADEVNQPLQIVIKTCLIMYQKKKHGS